MTNPTIPDTHLLRLNVGFLLKEGAGFSREIPIDFPHRFAIDDASFNNLSGSLRLTRTPQGILVQGLLDAQSPAECVRCLTPFDLFFSFEISELFRLRTSEQPDDDQSQDLNIIDEGGFIDLSPIVREEGILAVPIQPLCTPDCKGLCSQCGQDLNEGTCDCINDHIDPRLAPLRALLEDE